jgi:hypothetical protein
MYILNFAAIATNDLLGYITNHNKSSFHPHLVNITGDNVALYSLAKGSLSASPDKGVVSIETNILSSKSDWEEYMKLQLNE